MMTVSVDIYNYDKEQFFNRHNNTFTLETSGRSAEYYRKTYIFDDGAIWYEVMKHEEVTELVNVRGCMMNITVEMMSTEYWSSDDSNSNVYYEPWLYK